MNPTRPTLALAVAAVALLVSAAAGSEISAGPAAAGSSLDAKSEALALVTDLRNALDGYVVRLGSASGNVTRLSSSSSAKTREAIAAELLSISSGIEALDTKLKVLDARVASLSSTATSKTTTSATTAASAGSTSGNFRVTCEVTDRTVGEAETVEYSAVVSGGSKPYSYEWSGAFEGNGSTQKVSFVDVGTYRETLVVTDKKNKKLSDECPKVDVDKSFANGADGTAERAKNASITITAPTAGAKITTSTLATISWKHAGLASSDLVDIYLTGGGDGVTYYVASTLEKGDSKKGSFVWPSAGTVATAFVPYGTYTLKVCTSDNEICGATSVTLQRP